MADSAVGVKTGSDANMDTRTEGTNSNHRQVVVLGDPATNAGVAPVDATTGLAVNITAGEAHVGQVGAVAKVLVVTPTVSASPDYSADDNVGGKITLDGIARANDKTGTIVSVTITCDVDIPVGNTFDVIFFGTDPTNSTFTDNSAIAINVADLHFVLGVAQLFTRVDVGTPCMMISGPLNIPYKAASGTDDIYCVIVVRNASTLNLAGTSDINLAVGVLQD